METNRIRKIIAILFVVLFLVTVTVSAVSAAGPNAATSPTKTVSSIKQNNSPIEATASSLPWPLNLPRTHYPGDESP